MPIAGCRSSSEGHRFLSLSNHDIHILLERRATMLVWDEDNHLRLSRITERTEPGQLLMVSDIVFQNLSDILPLSQSPGAEYVNLISVGSTSR